MSGETGGADVPGSPPVSWLVGAAEVLAIAALFGVLAGTPVPDVNEAHYLTKARHYWDPTFCDGDLFLESADAHQVFYWVFGWVTLLMPLPVAAWVGRLLCWTALAWGWRQLGRAVALPPWGVWLTAAVFVAAQRNLQMAGEWVVGGVEAKCLAYALVFAALGEFSRGRWRAVWLLLGPAVSLHVLVGGWTLVVSGLIWLVESRGRGWLRQVPAMLGGALLALPGLLPALRLSQGVEPSVASAAASIYVYERLPHHLALHTFRWDFLARMWALVMVWVAGWWTLSPGQSTARRRLQMAVAGALGIALIGVAIEIYSRADRLGAAGLLRFYWYRLADVMLPLGVVHLWAEALQRLPDSAGGAWRRPLRCALAVAPVVAAGWMLAGEAWDAQRQGVPGAVYQLRKRNTPLVDRRGDYQDWLEACEWVRTHVRRGALFLTPRHQQTFKWYAERGEVTNWKDVPQDAVELVHWWRRQNTFFPPGVRHGVSEFRDDVLAFKMWRLGATHVILDRTKDERRLGAPWFERLHPASPSDPASPDDHGSTFEVYELLVEPRDAGVGPVADDSPAPD